MEDKEVDRRKRNKEKGIRKKRDKVQMLRRVIKTNVKPRKGKGRKDTGASDMTVAQRRLFLWGSFDVVGEPGLEMVNKNGKVMAKT